MTEGYVTARDAALTALLLSHGKREQLPTYARVREAHSDGPATGESRQAGVIYAEGLEAAFQRLAAKFPANVTAA
jgi:hypothetical protein